MRVRSPSTCPATATRRDVRADLWGSADHLVAGGRAVYVGYSMGGRVALHAALRHPDAVERLVLIGATAGIDDADERAATRAPTSGSPTTSSESASSRSSTNGSPTRCSPASPTRPRMRDDRLRNTATGWRRACA